LTVPEMCILYPEITPLAANSKQFSERLSEDEVRERVSPRFGLEPDDKLGFDRVLLGSKID